MNAKQFLKQAYRLNELILSNQRELDDLKVMSTSIGSIDHAADRVQTSPSGDARYTSIVAKIIELEKEIQEDIDKLFALKIEIRNAINDLDDNDEKLILKNRYLNFMTWDQIGQELHMSARTMKRKEASALDHIQVPD